MSTTPQTALELAARDTLMTTIKRHQKTITALVGNMLDPQRFATLAVTQIRANPQLLACSPASFLNSVILATQMGIEIRRDSAYLVPFGKICTLLIDYKAKIGLARRGGKVGGIQAVAIHQNDEFRYWYDEKGFHVHHQPSPKGRVLSGEERGLLIGVYAFAEVIGNGTGMQWREPMSIDELERLRKRSRAGAGFMTLEEIRAAHQLSEDGSKAVWQNWEFKDKRRVPWVTDYEEMAKKSAIHSLCKGLPLDLAGQLSQEVDEGFETGKQPSVIDESLPEFDTVENLPMLPEGSSDAQSEVVGSKLVEMGKDLSKIPPAASTLSAINRFKKTIGGSAADPRNHWIEIMGSYGRETTAQIATEQEARTIKQLMQDREADMEPK